MGKKSAIPAVKTDEEQDEYFWVSVSVWKLSETPGDIQVFPTEAQSWTCPTRTCRNTSLTWTSWWPSSSTAQCELWLRSSLKRQHTWSCFSRFFFFSESTRNLNCCTFVPQKVFLLPSAAVPQLQVPDAHPAKWDEGVGGTEESSTPRLLQYPQGEADEPAKPNQREIFIFLVFPCC